MITQELVRELFDYCDGVLYWKTSRGKSKAGKVAGKINSKGYHAVGVNKKLYLAHRLIYLYHHGILPKYIDHVDGNKLNNTIENLRECTLAQNSANSKAQKNNTSGAKGVFWIKRIKSWQVSLSVNGKRKHIGNFKDFELAELVAIEAREKYHKDFARHA
jgi:hypothetical protein